MQGLPDHSRQTFVRKLDSVVGNLNVLLIALAIGLAVLDATIFVGLTISRELPRHRELLGSAAEPNPQPRAIEPGRADAARR